MRTTTQLYKESTKHLRKTPTIKEIRNTSIIALSLLKETILRCEIVSEETLEMEKEEIINTLDDCKAQIESVIDDLYTMIH